MLQPRVARLVRDIVAQWRALLTGSGLVLVTIPLTVRSVWFTTMASAERSNRLATTEDWRAARQ